VSVNWIKVAKHKHVAGRFTLMRREAFGGHQWLVFCNGNHPNHKRCPSEIIVGADTIGEAKTKFERALQDPKGWRQPGRA
jgi:hypothetical protein